MTSYHEPGAQIIIVLRAVRVISRGVRGKVNFGTACVFSGAYMSLSFGWMAVRNDGRVRVSRDRCRDRFYLARRRPSRPLHGHYQATWPLADGEASS